MSAQVAVDARALEADELAQVDGGPSVLSDCERRARGPLDGAGGAARNARGAGTPQIARGGSLRLAGQSAQIWFSGSLMSCISFLRFLAASFSSAL